MKNDKNYIIMGVTGSGKSTVGSSLAQHLNLPFLDADDFHSPENIIKMSAGIPLSDDDRKPWLETLAQLLIDKTPCVLACSAPSGSRIEPTILIISCRLHYYIVSSLHLRYLKTNPSHSKSTQTEKYKRSSLRSVGLLKVNFSNL